MTSHVTSTDGTRIAFDRLGGGDGLPLVVVGGLLCDRERTRDVAEGLAEHLAGRVVVNYDRRGRGESTDTRPYAVDREIDDLAALIAEVAGPGGSAAVYGHSSGAGLALRAAARGLPIGRLVLHEPPYGPDDPESREQARQLGETVRTAIEQDRPGDAIRAFMGEAGMPPEMVEAIAADAKMIALAPTMPNDHEVMGDVTDGGTIPEALVRAITAPTLVVSGGTSPEFFERTASRIAELLPDGRHVVIDGHGHDAPAAVVAPVVAGFLSDVRA